MFQAVIFDMDGLMFDTERLAKQAWGAVGEHYGVKIGEAVLSRIRGAVPEASAQVFREAFGDDFPYWEARKMRNANVAASIEREGVPVKPGLAGLLKQLRQAGIHTAVASASATAQIERYLELSGLRGYLDALVGADLIGRSKPAPDGFLAAAKRLDTPPAGCLVLEDSANGLLAAKNAGMTAVCIPDIAPPVDTALRTAAAVLPSLGEVWDWMNRQ